MKVTSTEQGLSLTGELVYGTVSDIDVIAKNLLKKHPSQSITIDCKNLSKLDSAGIALLIEWKRWCSNDQKQFKIINANQNALALIENYKLTEMLGFQIN